MYSISLLRVGILSSLISLISALPYTSLTLRQDTSCQAVHIFLSKGWNEPYPGRQGKLAGAICYGLASCDYEDIQFYNAEGSDYCAAVSEGTVNGLAQMTAYAERCPDAQLVLSGYSQGANVAGNLIGGGDADGCIPDSIIALDPSVSPGNKRKFYLVNTTFFSHANVLFSQCHFTLWRCEARGQSAIQCPRRGCVFV